MPVPVRTVIRAGQLDALSKAHSRRKESEARERAMESAEASDQAPPTEEEGPSSSSSADALKAAGQIMTLEGEAKGCLDRCARARFFFYIFIFFSVPLRPFVFFCFCSLAHIA